MPQIKRFIVGILETNCYVVTSDTTDDAVIIDVGGGFSKIKAYLTENKKKPVAVLCTHGHFDHVMDCRRWQDEGVPIYLHDGDNALISGEADLGLGVKIVVHAFDDRKYVKNGDILSFSDMVFRVIYTPGHSIGSVCYVLNEETVFSGDTLMYHSFGRFDLYKGDYREIVSSVRNLLSGEKDMLVLPGHGSSTTIKEERMMNPIRDES